MKNDRLLLVHVSDVHVGSTLQGGGHFWNISGHEFNALQAFVNALEEITLRDGTRVLLMTGDASARGDDAELARYIEFCDHGFPRNQYTWCSAFRDGFDDFLHIPGNHDYWGGPVLSWFPNPILNHPARTTYFGPEPWRMCVPCGRHLVALHGLCSTSGTDRREQFWAVGQFADADLRTVEASIGSANTQATKEGREAFHILVTHHSPSHGTDLIDGLADHSQEELARLRREKNVRGVLCGHSHDREIVAPSLRFPAEVRCSTTMQKNVWPKRNERQFWVHELSDNGFGLDWHATPWVFDLHGAFEELTDERQLVRF